MTGGERALGPGRRPGATPSVLTMGGALLLVMALLAPGAGASITVPPYRGTHVTVTNSTTWIGCIGLNVSRPPVFHPLSGNLSLKASSSARSCGAGHPLNRTDSSVQWDGGWTITFPITFTKSGAHWVNSSWWFAWSGADAYSVTRACAGTPNSTTSYGYLSCQAFAAVSWDGITSVIDLSNGSTYRAPLFFPGALNISSWLWNEACYTGCTTTHSATGTHGTTSGPSRFNSSVAISGANASHRYMLVVGLTAQLLTDVRTISYNFHGVTRLLGTARASIDMSPGRFGGHLLSIGVS